MACSMQQEPSEVRTATQECSTRWFRQDWQGKARAAHLDVPACKRPKVDSIHAVPAITARGQPRVTCITAAQTHQVCEGRRRLATLSTLTCHHSCRRPSANGMCPCAAKTKCLWRCSESLADCPLFEDHHPLVEAATPVANFNVLAFRSHSLPWVCTGTEEHVGVCTCVSKTSCECAHTHEPTCGGTVLPKYSPKGQGCGLVCRCVRNTAVLGNAPTNAALAQHKGLRRS